MPVTHYDHDKKQNVTDYVGAVLQVKRETERVMSDVWEDHTNAYCWDPNRGVVKIYVSGGGYCEGCSATVDATPAVLNAYQQWLYCQNYESGIIQEQNEAKTPRKGKVLRVVSGNTAVGVVGKAIAEIESQYNMGWKSQPMKKFGIATSDRQGPVVAKNGRTYMNYLDVVWVWACNLVVDNPDQYVDTAKVAKAAQENTNHVLAQILRNK